MDYADASVIVAAFTSEPASVASAEWLAALAPGALMASKWCETEIISALAIKTRTGALEPSSRAIVFGAIRTMLATSAVTVPVEAHHFEAAIDLVARSTKPLRGGDALHLAIARSNAAMLWTLDRKMMEAGQALALDVRLIT